MAEAGGRPPGLEQPQWLGFAVGDGDLDEQNPYEPPMSLAGKSRPVAAKKDRAGWRLYVVWGTVFAFNMALPLLIGWQMTEEHGRLGLLAAVAILFVLGCCLCASDRRFAIILIVGAVFVGLSQVIPILQAVAGVIGLVMGQVVGGVEPHKSVDVTFREVINDLGGFVAMFVTGGILMGASAACGVLVRKFTPDRWWKKADKVEEL